jgi:hypothetical protein
LLKLKCRAAASKARKAFKGSWARSILSALAWPR